VAVAVAVPETVAAPVPETVPAAVPEMVEWQCRRRHEPDPEGPGSSTSSACAPARATRVPPALPSPYLLGWGVSRRYGFTALKPFGNRSLASSSERAGTMITSSPSFQLTGVATL
jgi:hypothetical protein